MSILLSIGLILLALSILVVIHELGHFWAARFFGMKVETFSLFFGPKLFAFKWGETEWRVCLIPLGGYVKISGMLDESMDKEQLAKDPEPWEFRSKPRWQRLIVMLGGIFMNIVLGVILFIYIKLMYGETYTPMENLPYGIEVVDGSAVHDLGFRTGDKIVSYKGTPIKYFEDIADPRLLVDWNKYFEVERDGKKLRIEMPNDYLSKFQAEKSRLLFTPRTASNVQVISDSMMVDSAGNFIIFPAWKAGMRTGDSITMIDSVPVKFYGDVFNYIKAHKDIEMLFDVRRGNNNMQFAIAPDTSGKIGIGPDWPNPDMQIHIDYSFGEALTEGPREGMLTLVRQVKSLAMLGSGNADVAKNVSGPLQIAKFYEVSFKAAGWEAFWTLTAMLSMVLAVMNLLPIPVLDGGHVVFLLIESVMGRDIPMKIKEIAMQIGFFLLIALMALVFLNDILKIFS